MIWKLRTCIQALPFTEGMISLIRLASWQIRLPAKGLTPQRLNFELICGWERSVGVGGASSYGIWGVVLIDLSNWFDVSFQSHHFLWAQEPSHSQEWSSSNFSCGLTSNITSHSMKNLVFHSLLRRKMILLPILTTSSIHFSLGRLGECTFWTWELKG